MGTGPYGELDGSLEWPAELYEWERREEQIAIAMKMIYARDERLRCKGIFFSVEMELTFRNDGPIAGEFEGEGGKVERRRVDVFLD